MKVMEMSRLWKLANNEDRVHVSDEMHDLDFRPGEGELQMLYSLLWPADMLSSYLGKKKLLVVDGVTLI